MAHGFHDGNSRIYWESTSGTTPVLQVCKHEVADLLIIGASERENFELPAGNFAKEIVKKAKCSVLVYSGHNQNKTHELIIVNAQEHRKTRNTINTAHYIAKSEHAKEIVIVEESRYRPEYNDDPDVPVIEVKEKQLHNSVKGSYTITRTSLNDEDCKSISEYAFRSKADLLIVNSTDHHLQIFDRIVSEEIDVILDKLPCDFLIVHSRLPE
jgi:hypothetical protein